MEKYFEKGFSSLFDDQTIDNAAKQCKFITRKRKLDAKTFLMLIVFNNENLKKESLNDLSIKLNREYGIDLKKQSLDEKFVSVHRPKKKSVRSRRIWGKYSPWPTSSPIATVPFPKLTSPLSDS